MTNYFEINGKDLTEKVNNAIAQNLNCFVRPTNSDEDHYFFFENESEASDYISKFDSEEVEVWDLTDEGSNAVLLED